jgi:hypothetical protein
MASVEVAADRTCPSGPSSTNVGCVIFRAVPPSGELRSSVLRNQNRVRCAAGGAPSGGAGACSLHPAVNAKIVTMIRSQEALHPEAEIAVDRALMLSTRGRYTRIPSCCIPSNAA